MVDITPGTFNYIINTTNLMHTSLSLHFIDYQCLDMFRASLAHPQEALHGRRIGGYYVQLYMWVGLTIWQVMPETCRDIEHQ
jgi:hypothetical protein